MRILFICLVIAIASQLSAQNLYRVNSRFKPDPFDVLYKDGNHGIPKSIGSGKLKGYVVKRSDNEDSLIIKFWDIDANDPLVGRVDKVNSMDNGSTWTYLIKYNDRGILKVPFSAFVYAAANIPFRYRTESHADLDANFLNAGVSGFWVWGKTRYYKQSQIGPRQNYGGIGFFLGFSQVKLDSAATAGKLTVEHDVAAVSYGVNAMYSWNEFALILAFGADNAFGYNAKLWKENNFQGGFHPWVDFGFGFNILGGSLTGQIASQGNN